MEWPPGQPGDSGFRCRPVTLQSPAASIKNAALCGTSSFSSFLSFFDFFLSGSVSCWLMLISLLDLIGFFFFFTFSLQHLIALIFTYLPFLLHIFTCFSPNNSKLRSCINIRIFAVCFFFLCRGFMCSVCTRFFSLNIYLYFSARNFSGSSSVSRTLAHHLGGGREGGVWELWKNWYKMAFCSKMAWCHQSICGLRAESEQCGGATCARWAHVGPCRHLKHAPISDRNFAWWRRSDRQMPAAARINATADQRHRSTPVPLLLPAYQTGGQRSHSHPAGRPMRARSAATRPVININ